MSWDDNVKYRTIKLLTPIKRTRLKYRYKKYRCSGGDYYKFMMNIKRGINTYPIDSVIGLNLRE